MKGMSAGQPVRARLERWRILIPSCMFAPFLAYLVYVGLSHDPEIGEIVFIAAFVVAGLGILANYLWLDYLQVDDRAVRRVQFLGLVRKDIPIGRLARVRKGRVRPLLFAYDSLRFSSSDITIEVPYEAYEKAGVVEVLQRLRARGIDIDDPLLKQLRPE